MMMSTTRYAAALVAAMGMLAVGGCKPSDILNVPAPSGVTSSTAYQNQAGGELIETTRKGLVFQGFASAFNGVLSWSSLLADEFRWAFFSYDGEYANIDARITTGTGGFQEAGDTPLSGLLGARVELGIAISILKKYEPPSGRYKIGEAYALTGYTEIWLAEDYCAGVPLGALVDGVGPEYGTPLTTDSVLAVAESDFDSALVYGVGNDSVTNLASIGLGRARLNRAKFADAATAVMNVPTGFVYNAELGTTEREVNATEQLPNLYAFQTGVEGCGLVNVADRKGGDGMNYVSADDPRLVLDSAVAKTCDGEYGGADSVWYYPVKFGNPSVYVPIATGIEARLIQAEAALQAGQAGTWASDLNALRADNGDTHVTFPSGEETLGADSTTALTASQQADVMFRERAFWLYGTGTRLGDMRRLVRQYGRNEDTVYPVGPFPNGNAPSLPRPIPTYGTDVNLTLPTPGNATTPNPNYKGCLTGSNVA